MYIFVSGNQLNFIIMWKTTFFVYADDKLIKTCKTKTTAVKYAQQALNTLLYNDVRIEKMAIRKLNFKK